MDSPPSERVVDTLSFCFEIRQEIHRCPCFSRMKQSFYTSNPNASVRHRDVEGQPFGGAALCLVVGEKASQAEDFHRCKMETVECATVPGRVERSCLPLGRGEEFYG
jgi:hypothetical protein